ncbi:hypothetical protein J2792_001931 [Novosphingobium capsulatum]|uniref:Uncharacterized protein n=1 Tax=Novosphingobium capsulatum TaxID=13688 RepID=A0ABU1ML45_9SPHN|nr:hypothetical protein [Novosphingobium sp. BK256]MBB3374551.1 hypothetical protein [Novosphingobium sp. BK280]MBB3378963.1 hypothetical protein [Novosphingobium sp. BK258]MBB3420657.1 hypothetical protein [Novosphingobium sp. BK267]MBB3448221.1 hypothetical protein [Novosphingobium sp. BK352]MBB3477626.1 hypothetical protein [Novosphingobium sp. BK369]MBB3500935.1 hypothetical protein [Novosphingobium sp. BK336]MBB3536923.1 hypothetical protein [Novosphingobium sp. BK486]MBB3556320.1 hypo
MTRARSIRPEACRAQPGPAILTVHSGAARIPEEVVSPLAHHQRKEIGL